MREGTMAVVDLVASAIKQCGDDPRWFLTPELKPYFPESSWRQAQLELVTSLIEAAFHDGIVDGGRARYVIHEHAHSYGLNVIPDPAMAHRYVVWVQPTFDPATRFETPMYWVESRAFDHAASWLMEWREKQSEVIP